MTPVPSPTAAVPTAAAPMVSAPASAARNPAAPWVALVGPTACGKSGVALMVAHHLPVEIISVDSALVYRGLDIGTAKPSRRQREQVPHHLIDILDPLERYSAARFAHDARALITEIHGRGRLPLLVGGTLLYLKALIEGLDAMPPTDDAVRDALLAEGRERGWPALHAELAQVDPTTAARLAPHDAQRIQRALEVWRQTGQPLSSFHTQGQPDTASPRGLQPAAFISLEPRERAWLHERIALRLDYMLDEGLIQEVQALRERGDLHADLPSIRSVGYRQAWEALDAGLAGPALREAVGQRALYATRQLAKRQMTWLRSLPQRTVLDAQDPASADAVVQACRAALEGA